MQSWEVIGQLLGLLTSVAFLSAIDGTKEWEIVVVAWVAVHSLHVGLRYVALSTLCLDTINFQRGRVLARAHVDGLEIPGLQ